MKSVAIIGAGFSGLALAFYLSQEGKCKVTLFDGKGIGGGASGIAAGLLHPYPGEQCRRSWKAEEGLSATLQLLKISEQFLGRPVAQTHGVIRAVYGQEQTEAFLQHASEYGDVERIGENQFLIRSGITVYASAYLQGLWLACKEKGAVFYQAKIDSLEQLKAYDHIILASGAGLFQFEECRHLKVRLVKGQVLTCQWPSSLPPLERSLIGKGYLVRGESPEVCYVGATYEREFTCEAPDQARAEKELLPKISTFFPEAYQLKVVDCQAAVRVINASHYTPLMERINQKTWAITAMGSRGLLYHAYIGSLLKL